MMNDAGPIHLRDRLLEFRICLLLFGRLPYLTAPFHALQDLVDLDDLDSIRIKDDECVVDCRRNAQRMRLLGDGDRSLDACRFLISTVS